MRSHEGSQLQVQSMCTATLAGDDASNGEEVTTSVKPNSASGTTLGSVAADAPAERPSLADLRHHESFPADRPAVPVFFLSDSTGISAETMGNALLIQFPFLRFDRRLIPFINSLEEARKVVAILDAAMDGPVTPLAFTTAAVDEIRIELNRSRCPIIDFFELHMAQVESILQARGERVVSQLHDDGQSLRALDKADVILVAPSRCGKTPTTMYLALQHGIFVANYPLVDEDLDQTQLPRPIQALRDRCYGIVTTPARLRQVRQERRPNSTYASLEQCTWELRRAEALFAANTLPIINSSMKSVEEMSTVILQTLANKA
jgi:[pyruvate, water dikinase]-phosphate phosphotransferase / [pyruvate, water dikinase] kinase